MTSETQKKNFKQLWMVEEIPGKVGIDGRPKSYWTKVGVAFENRDGSWSLHLAAVPVNGKLQMRDPQTDEEKEAFRERMARTSAGAAA